MNVLATSATCLVTLLNSYVAEFNAVTRSFTPTRFPTPPPRNFAQSIPLFECPDKTIERTYYFRWWTYRKHLRKTPSGCGDGVLAGGGVGG